MSVPDSQQIEHSAAAWLARRDAGPWSADDQAQLAAWLEHSVAHRIAFIRLEHAWRQSGRLKALGAGADRGKAAACGQIPATQPAANQRLPTDVLPDVRRHGHGSRARLVQHPVRYLAVAAITLLTLSVGWGWWHYANTIEVDYQTTIGALDTVKLADGSTVTLNSDSRVHVAFSNARRSIDLQQGEAYFAVARDPGRPFVVHADGRRVTAIGTAFAVRRDADSLRVVVTHGVVRMEADRSPGAARQATTLLPAGSVAVASAAGVLVRSDSVQQARDLLAWRNGYLSFHDTPLANAAAEFNRYNTHKIVIGDPAVGALRIGGNFRWSNADAFVRLLEQGFPIHVVRRDDTLVLQHR